MIKGDRYWILKSEQIMDIPDGQAIKVDEEWFERHSSEKDRVGFSKEEAEKEYQKLLSMGYSHHDLVVVKLVNVKIIGVEIE